MAEALKPHLNDHSLYPSSHNHGSEKWVPPIVVTFQMQPFYTSMIMGESVNSSASSFSRFWVILKRRPSTTGMARRRRITLPKLMCSSFHPILVFLPWEGICLIIFWEYYCWCFRNPALTTWDVKNPVNNGINYQPQLVSRISEPSTVPS